MSFYTIGFSYVEDCAPAGKGAVLFGLIRMTAALGPAFGYVGGAAELTRFVDFDKVNETELEIDKSDPAWVGAWWIGIMVACGMAFICALPIFGYPKQIPGVAKVKASKKNESLDTVENKDDLSFLKGAKILLKNKVFLFASLGMCMDAYMKESYTDGLDFRSVAGPVGSGNTEYRLV